MFVHSLCKFNLQETFSTLDLVSLDKVEFVLIIAPLEESYNLAQAAFKVAKEHKIPIMVCVIWPEKTTDGSGKTEAALEPWTNFIEVVELRNSPTSISWWDVCQMTDRGAILVRPDEHIAWRTKFGITADPVLEMERVFCTIFGTQPRHT